MVGTLPGVRLRLKISDGGDGKTDERSLNGSMIQIGRGPGNDIAVSDPRVSSVHGRILFDGGELRFQDLGSTNGSAVIRKGKKLPLDRGEEAWFCLQPGDRILLGDAEQPSSIELLEVNQTDGAVPEATIMAQRAIGHGPRLSSNEAYAGLLGLLAGLRTEQDSNAVAQRVLGYLVQAVPGVSRATCLMKQEQGDLQATLTIGPNAESRPDRPVSVRLLDKVCQSREVLLIEDLQQTADPTASMLQSTARSLILAPLLRVDEAIGAIQISSAEGNRFAESDLELVAVLAHQLSALLSGTHLIERLRAAEAKLRGQCEVLKHRLGQRPAMDEMSGASPAMEEVRRQIIAVAHSRTTVMIHGETGVGKELVARGVHETSPRADGPFPAVNCSALATGLLESELFGHIKGAFTGAVRDRKGLFEVANGGTLFLDEIGDMPAQLQPKLLRVLEQGSMTPVGGSREIGVDVRVVTATHRDLEKEVAAGRFRQDLLFRLNVFTLVVPPLRQRPEDIIELAHLFLDRFSKEQDRSHPGFTARATAALQTYDWPGNVRELKNEMERSSLMAGHGEAVDLIHLSARLGGQSSLDGEAKPTGEGNLKDIMERLEAQVVRSVLDRHDSNRTHAARALGISRQALITKISKLGLDQKT